MSEATAMDTDGLGLPYEQVSRFHGQGFVVVPGFLDAGVMTQVEHWCQEIASWSEVPGRHMVYGEEHRQQPGRRVLSRIENFCPFHAGLNRLLRGPRLLGCLHQLFGEPPLLFKDNTTTSVPAIHQIASGIRIRSTCSGSSPHCS